ncbi:cytochrome c biogenesis protein CcdA [Clostridium muellerianum]|nr:cytochrome c biogenesis protein CcdA [Clostridium muellerianum]
MLIQCSQCSYKKYNEKGLIILGFPCNQFADQDPAENSEIKRFYEMNFGVTFPLFEKVDVRGKNAHSLFKHLTEAAPCIGPILASILIYAGNMNTINKGITLLCAYSLGLAVPFILAALLIESFSSQIKKLYKYFPIISAVPTSYFTHNHGKIVNKNIGAMNYDTMMANIIYIK